jgi:hypothetical protein
MSQTDSGAHPVESNPFQKTMNNLMGIVLRTPLHGPLSKSLMTLAFIGRKSGKRYQIPVAYAERDGVILVTSKANWWKNLQGGATVNLWLRGEKRIGTCEVDTDVDGISAGYKTLLSASPRLGEMIGVTLDADGEPDREQVAQARENGYVLLRITLMQ